MEQETKNYRKTVLTPQTAFPMKAGLPDREPERLKKWEESRLYHQMQELRAGAETFILHDGPPYANGNIHLGHALNKILKDVIVRFWQYKGYRSPYVPGWDCHGLPIEQQVLKKLGPKIHQMPASEVRKLCHEYAAEFINIQREQFKRLGVTGDWDKPYATFDPIYEVGILSALRDLVANGLVRKGKRSVHWDPVYRTALAEAEIEYHTHTSDSIYVKFPLRNADKYPSIKGLENASLVIWTTTPWTLPANVAVTLHPEFDYVALKVDSEHLIVAKELAETFLTACKLKGEVVRTFKAPELEKAETDHPIFADKSSLVILGEHVTLEAGTGCVHTAPGHGAEDFYIGQRYGLPVVVPVDESGRFTEEFPDCKGELVFDANPKIVEMIRAKGILVAAGKVTHEYPYSWRSHKPIIFRATEQWFVELGEGGMRERALKAIDAEVKWIPPWGRDRIHGMVSQRPDWCVSRQRSWGVPIPSIRSKKSNESLLDTRIIEAFMKVVAKKGTDAWFTDSLESFWPEGFVYEKTGESRPEDFEKEFDILDVWFDSGSSHIAVLEQDERLHSPADLYLEGSDQHRGWFQSSLLISIGTRNRAPYKAVLTHGFLLDGEGRAMSKSLGNVISPLDVVKKMGADILRLWVCSEDYRADLKVSDEILNRIAESYRKIRNGMRFMLGNLYDFDPKRHLLPVSELEEMDRWILAELARLVEQCDSSYSSYQFHKVYHLVYGFSNTLLSALYLDVTKDRLYCSAPEDKTRRAAQSAIYHVLDTLTRLLAPILVFTTEEVREFGPFEKESVHLTDFPKVDGSWRNPELLGRWEKLMDLREEVSVSLEEARRAKTIGHSLDASLEITAKDESEEKFLSEILELLKILFIVSDVQIRPADGGTGKRSFRVTPAPWEKCERCWMKKPQVGKDPQHPTLCDRCSDVVRRTMTA